jgi:hypothetical protein
LIDLIGLDWIGLDWIGLNWIGNEAIIFECIRTIAAITPNAVLLDEAAAAVGRFISAKNNSLKFVGYSPFDRIIHYSIQSITNQSDCNDDYVGLGYMDYLC